MDGTWLSLRREGASGGKAEYEGECIMVAVGIDASGRKNVLGYWTKPTEGASKWVGILGSLKSRGLRSPRLFAADGLSGMPEAISNVFTGAKHQRCWVHLVRNTTSEARKKDGDEISGDAKRIYGSKDRASAEAELRSFVSKGARRYPSFEKCLMMPGLFELMSFPQQGLAVALRKQRHRRLQLGIEEEAEVARRHEQPRERVLPHHERLREAQRIEARQEDSRLRRDGGRGAGFAWNAEVSGLSYVVCKGAEASGRGSVLTQNSSLLSSVGVKLI